MEDQFGESEVRGAARAETRFHFRTGITSVVPWLVVSEGERAIGNQRHARVSFYAVTRSATTTATAGACAA